MPIPGARHGRTAREGVPAPGPGIPRRGCPRGTRPRRDQRPPVRLLRGARATRRGQAIRLPHRLFELRRVVAVSLTRLEPVARLFHPHVAGRLLRSSSGSRRRRSWKTDCHRVVRLFSGSASGQSASITASPSTQRKRCPRRNSKRRRARRERHRSGGITDFPTATRNVPNVVTRRAAAGARASSERAFCADTLDGPPRANRRSPAVAGAPPTSASKAAARTRVSLRPETRPAAATRRRPCLPARPGATRHGRPRSARATRNTGPARRDPPRPRGRARRAPSARSPPGARRSSDAVRPAAASPRQAEGEGGDAGRTGLPTAGRSAARGSSACAAPPGRSPPGPSLQRGPVEPRPAPPAAGPSPRARASMPRTPAFARAAAGRCGARIPRGEDGKESARRSRSGRRQPPRLLEVHARLHEIAVEQGAAPERMEHHRLRLREAEHLRGATAFGRGVPRLSHIPCERRGKASHTPRHWQVRLGFPPPWSLASARLAVSRPVAKSPRERSSLARR